jgi:WD40 repeat protein
MKKRNDMKMVLLTFSLTTIFALAIVFSHAARPGVGEHEEVVGGIVNYHETKFQDDPRNIYIVNKITGDKRFIYQSPKAYVDWISVSPNREFIAGIEPEDSTKNRLLIIDPKGNITHLIIDDVRKYDWSPDGEKIAYITGTYYEGGVGFMTTGVWIFNLRDHSKTQIKKDFPHQTVKTTGGELFEGGGFQINWTEHDSNIYIQDFGHVGGVYRYNTKISKSEKVDYKGIDFSPDGKYYARSIPELDYQVYLAETNEPVTERLSARFKDLRFLPTWVPDEKHYLQIVKVDFIVEPVIPGRQGGKILGVRQKKYTIYDIETDQIIKEWIEKPEE